MTVYLTEPTLGRLDLGPIVLPDVGCHPVRLCNAEGYVVTDWTVGAPAVRAVQRNRALADGTVDDTAFVGARAISMNVLIDTRVGDPQLTIDRLTPYLSPRYRPRLHWTIPRSTQERSIVVRGVDYPLSIAGIQAHVIPCQWVGPDGMLESPTENLTTINPGTDVEEGRTYDLAFDRVYPPSLPIGGRLIVNAGNAVANWVATIFGPCELPSLTFNGVTIDFTNGGGVELTGGTSLVIDSRNRTVLLNGDPAESRYDKMNFADWSWEQVRLQPGDNLVTYGGDVIGPASSVQLRWRSAYL